MDLDEASQKIGLHEGLDGDCHLNDGTTGSEFTHRKKKANNLARFCHMIDVF